VNGIHYPCPVHLLPAYVDLGYKAGDFPYSELTAAQTFSLLIFAELTDSQIAEVKPGRAGVQNVKNYLSGSCAASRQEKTAEMVRL